MVGTTILITTWLLVLLFQPGPSAAPLSTKELRVRGLSERAEVYRDGFGTPHIFTKNNDDLFLAFGYVTAEDRLFQIDYARRTLSGTLAAVRGPAFVEQDRYYRTIGLKRLADEILQRTDPATRRALDRFASGVNAYIAGHEDAAPVEFVRLGYTPSPWTASDCILVFKSLGYTIDVARWRSKIGLQLIEKRFGDRARDFFPSFAAAASTVIKPGEMAVPPGSGSSRLPGRVGYVAPDDWLGSNNWVVSGKKSVTGKPLFAADPHYRISAPPFWYEVTLRGGDYDYSGVVIAGSPFMLFGHNPHIAWSITAAFVDSVDVYEERIDPNDARRYSYKGQWETVRTVPEVIAVKGASDVVEQVRLTRHGPIVAQSADGAGTEYSLRWTDYERKGDEMAALRLVSTAANWADFTSALRPYNTMATSWLYADRAGNIGYYLAGAIPIRKGGPAHAAVPGWTGDHDWQGYVPLDETPRLYNPPRGFIASSNNQIAGDWYPHYVSWRGMGYRQQRIEEVLQSKDKLSVDDFKRLQWDVRSTQPRPIVPLLLKAFEGRSPSAAVREALNRLTGWKAFDFEPSAVEPTIYDACYRRLAENTFLDEFGSELFARSRPGDVGPFLLQRPDSIWFDDVRTPERETMGDVLVRSFEEGVAALTNRLGADQNEWRWGRVNPAAIPHFAQSDRDDPVLGVYSLGPFPKEGRSGWTVDPGGSDSYRMIVDLSDLDATVSLLPPGNSGRPGDANHRDQVPLWTRGLFEGSYRNRYDSRDKIVASAKTLTVLSPR